MNKVKRALTLFSTAKLYMVRAMGYMSILNTFMIIYLFLKELDVITLSSSNIIFVFIGIISLMFLVIYVDDKIGNWERENKITSSRNPYLVEILERVKRLEKR